MLLCIPEIILSQKERYEIGGIGMFAASIGFIGAALQLRSLRQYKNTQRRRPSSNPAIIFYLAVSDLIYCVGTSIVHHCSGLSATLSSLSGVFASVIALMILELSFQKHAPIGAIFEIINYFGCLASYVWTSCFALDMCFQLYRIECPMVVYHILAWAIPFDLIAIIEGVKLIHYPDWCGKGVAVQILLFYIAIMVAVVANPIIFCVSYRKVKKLLRSSGCYTNVERAMLYTYRRRFFFFVIAFIVCWLPDLIFSTLYFWIENHEMRESQVAIWYFTVSVTPLQGMLNYFLYRRAFRVTAGDTRRGPDEFPRVRPQDAVLDRLISSRKLQQSSLRVNQYVQKNNATLSQDKEIAPLLTTLEENQNPTSRYVYTCRLLGE